MGHRSPDAEGPGKQQVIVRNVPTRATAAPLPGSHVDGGRSLLPGSRAWRSPGHGDGGGKMAIIYIRLGRSGARSATMRGRQRAAASIASSHAFELESWVGAGAYGCAGEETRRPTRSDRRQARGGPRQAAAAGALRARLACPDRDQQCAARLVAVPFVLAERRPGLCWWLASVGHVGPCRSNWPAMCAMAGSTKWALASRCLGEMVNEMGGGTESGRPVRAVQVGGPLGPFPAIQ